MKKIIALFLLLTFLNICTPALAISEEEQKQIMQPCENLYQKAITTNNAEDYIVSFECLYNQKNFKKLSKPIKDNTYMLLIAKNIERFELTKEKKYLKSGYKWSKVAVKEKSSDIFSLKSAALLASLNVKPKEIIKAYDTLCEVNINECQNFKPNFDELLANTKNYKVAQNEDTKGKWISGLKTTGYLLLLGIAGFGSGYSSAYKNYQQTNYQQNNPKTYYATTRKIGNTTYTTINGY